MTTTATPPTTTPAPRPREALTQRERAFVDVALEATRREHAVPSGARVLTAFEVLAARDLAAHLEAAGRAAAASVTSPVPPHSASGVDAGPTPERAGEPIPPDATGADPAAVEHGAA